MLSEARLSWTKGENVEAYQSCLEEDVIQDHTITLSKVRSSRYANTI